MSPILEGLLDAKGMRFALLVSRTNEVVTEGLLLGAQDCLLRHGASADDLTIVRVPGSFELPLAARKLSASKRHDAIIALGALIRGETCHFELLAAEAARGLAQAGIESGIPVTFAVLTTDTLEQAMERAGGKSGNKGWTAALAAIEMSSLYRRMV